MSWRDYWNSDTPIYVNERHRQLHYRRIATDLVALIDEICPQGKPVVLDYGCGEALEADQVAKRCGSLLLADAASTVVDHLQARFAGTPRIRVLHADHVETLPDASLDIVVVNSVIQYVARAEFDRLLSVCRAKLKPQGALALADVIPRSVGPVTDASALLRFAAQHGFLVAALTGLVRTALSDYRKLSKTLGVAHYDEQEMLGIVRNAGFAPTRRQPNLGINPARMTFVARATTGSAGR
jgi:trans-aconitate methyltransferase